ncbi:hypothetical protein EJ110_NYTH28524 [Nymphaea thermarum]|nr:hypothetical protein EJ110_NYTH28524 [Nymphaea thermarum]
MIVVPGVVQWLPETLVSRVVSSPSERDLTCGRKDPGRSYPSIYHPVLQMESGDIAKGRPFFRRATVVGKRRQTAGRLRATRRWFLCVHHSSERGRNRNGQKGNGREGRRFSGRPGVGRPAVGRRLTSLSWRDPPAATHAIGWLAGGPPRRCVQPPIQALRGRNRSGRGGRRKEGVTAVEGLPPATSMSPDGLMRPAGADPTSQDSCRRFSRCLRRCFQPHTSEKGQIFKTLFNRWNLPVSGGHRPAIAAADVWRPCRRPPKPAGGDLAVRLPFGAWQGERRFRCLRAIEREAVGRTGVVSSPSEIDLTCGRKDPGRSYPSIYHPVLQMESDSSYKSSMAYGLMRRTLSVAMGCFSSCFSLSSATNSGTFRCVRVVHLNGFVEDFAGPVAVREVASLESKQFVCSPAQLRLFDPHPLRQDAVLQPGQLYFLLPLSAFQSDTSPVNLAAIVGRLTAAANQATSSSGSAHVTCFSSIWKRNRSCTSINHQETDSIQERFSSLWGQSGDYSRINQLPSDSASSDPVLNSIGSRAQTWKPVLETIDEGSFRLLEP